MLLAGFLKNNVILIDKISRKNFFRSNENSKCLAAIRLYLALEDDPHVSKYIEFYENKYYFCNKIYVLPELFLLFSLPNTK
jgi:hypothetical protein